MLRMRHIFRYMIWKKTIIGFIALLGVVYFFIPMVHFAVEYKKFGRRPEIPKFVNKELTLLSDGNNLIQPSIQVQRKFVILFWEHGPRMLRRFVRSYGTKDLDPFKDCAYKNCEYRIDNLKDLNKSDAILIHLHRTKGPWDVPKYRRPDQKWIFFTDESPKNTFFLTKAYSMKDYNGIFNWSMTYRADSDIPVPYGRTVKLKDHEIRSKAELPDYFAKNTKGVAVMGSNCGGDNFRWPYIYELQKHIPVDTYGNCGTLKCPGGFMKDCPLLNGYKFYLAFENCNCKEYITEKLWWNAFAKESVPVVMGGTIEDYQKLCPPNSHIHVENFENPANLAKYLKYLLTNRTAYNEYFAWKTSYKVLNEHGYFHSPSRHICHLCEALNRAENSKVNSKVYNNLEMFWNPKKDCRNAKWKP